MSWLELIAPLRMNRIAIVAPTMRVRDMLVAVAAAGVVEPVRLPGRSGGEALNAFTRATAKNGPGALPPTPVLSSEAPDLVLLERNAALAELAGEAELETVAASMSRHGHVMALVGWSPSAEIKALSARLSTLGAAVLCRPIPPGLQPPTFIAKRGPGKAFQPLVDTYATVPYSNLNPSIFAGLAYVFMFGIMFGDVGHGMLLLLTGLLMFWRRIPLLVQFQAAAPFVIGAGITSMAFGLAYGEAFGPTKLVPTLWLAPLSAPLTLMAAAIAVGAAFLSVSYGLGTVNRWREGGFAYALVALSGFAGIALYLGLALVGLGWYVHLSACLIAGAGLATIGLVLAFTGLYAATGGRFVGVMEAGIELLDGVTRLGTNTISFARLAAFGMTHAALGAIVWNATAALWSKGPVFMVLAALVFLIGNTITFALEALVAAIQALRLEYYEMFSRIFVTPGNTFSPWRIPTLSGKEPS